jgi:hypothetical protein
MVVALDVYVHHFSHRTFHSLAVDTRRQLLESFECFTDKWGEEYGTGFAAGGHAPRQRDGHVARQHGVVGVGFGRVAIR